MSSSIYVDCKSKIYYYWFPVLIEFIGSSLFLLNNEVSNESVFDFVEVLVQLPPHLKDLLEELFFLVLVTKAVLTNLRPSFLHELQFYAPFITPEANQSVNFSLNLSLMSQYIPKNTAFMLLNYLGPDNMQVPFAEVEAGTKLILFIDEIAVVFFVLLLLGLRRLFCNILEFVYFLSIHFQDSVRLDNLPDFLLPFTDLQIMVSYDNDITKPTVRHYFFFQRVYRLVLLYFLQQFSLKRDNDFEHLSIISFLLLPCKDPFCALLLSIQN